jgi:hypothetical protein
MSMEIVVDLETLGTRVGCPIIEIGACAVDSENGAIVANFSRRVKDSLNCTIGEVERIAKDGDPYDGDKTETCRWWLKEEGRAAVLAAILGGGIPLRSALSDFADWMSGFVRGDVRPRLWANGPSFDAALLSEAYRMCDLPRPWSYRDERCVRTALDIAGYQRGSVAWEEDGPRHRALPDARHEARKLWRSGAFGEVSAGDAQWAAFSGREP